MNNESKPVVVTGTSLPTLLTVLFIALKLCGIIDWSWWWVLSPIPITVGVVLTVLVVSITVLTIGSSKKSTKKRPF
jgi:hypothetical protein